MPFAKKEQTGGKEGGISRNFILLFFVLMCGNSFLAVYYCFEQWLEQVCVTPNWRGLLLGVMYGMIMVTRPAVSFFMLSRSKLPAIAGSIIVSMIILLSYQYLPAGSPAFVWMIFFLRVVQGFFQAVFSSCAVAAIVSCFPAGRSAKGWAFYSIANLLPYAAIPTLGEKLLPLVGGEPRLFALIGLLGLPALVLTFFAAPHLRKPELAVSRGSLNESLAGIVETVRHSGLSLLFAASTLFCLTTSFGLLFMKGLCSQTGGDPAKFYLYYTSTMIVVRFTGCDRLDRLPRGHVVPVCAALMALAFLAIAWAPLWAYVPATFLYGLSLSLLYPLLAAEIVDRSTPETKTINSNFMMFTFDAAGLLASLFGGAVIDMGFGYRGVITLGAIMIASCGLCFHIDRLRLQTGRR